MRRVMVGALAPVFLLALVLAACDTAPNDLTVGKCIDQLPSEGSSVSGVNTADCAKPHQAEVFAVFTWPGNEGNDKFPGDDAMSQKAQSGCTDAFQPYVGVSIDNTSLSVTYLLPTSDSWGQGDRTFICLVSGPNGQQLSKSVKGTNQ